MTVTGRPVRIVSISFRNKQLDEVIEVVEREAATGVDLVVLPETFRGQMYTPETLEGPTVTAMSALASEYGAYIVCPIDRQEGYRRLNSAVLLDRSGKVACVYDKAYPYWSEFDLQPVVDVGQEVPVYEADFGRVGMAICFDVNFPEIWRRLADQDAEVVIWPGAYSGGAALQAYALMHHYYIVTSTQTCDCLVYDITGDQILYEQNDNLNISRVALDLDRGIYHENFNLQKRDRLLVERKDDVIQEQHLLREQWFVLRAKRPGISARELAHQYGLEELRDYINRSRLEIDRRRDEQSAQADLAVHN